MRTGYCAEDPVWQFAEGNSRSTLESQTLQTTASGAVYWQDPYAMLMVATPDLPEHDLTVAVNGYEQYNGVYYQPQPQQGWVFHLAQQQFSYPGNYSSGSPNMSSLDHLYFRVYAQLLQDDPNIRSGYDSNIHAAQFLIYFTVQNLNPNNSGCCAEYVWFGITLYDDRYDVPGLSTLQDAGGTERYIYNVGAAPFVNQGLQPGGTGLLFEGDLLPMMREALLSAWEHGFLTGSNVLSDYRIGGMNIGWEVTGLNDVSMRVSDLSLRYVTKPQNPVVFGFNTDGDREGWTLVNGTEITAGPQNGSWIFQVGATAAMLVSPELDMEAATHPIVRITMANDVNNPASVLKIYWDRFGDRGFREAWSSSVQVPNDGGMHTYEIDMRGVPGWEGEIHQVRIDPIQSGNGAGVAIDEISFSPAP